VKTKTLSKLVEAIETAAKNCTLAQEVSPPDGPNPKKTPWKEQIEREAFRIRGI